MEHPIDCCYLPSSVPVIWNLVVFCSLLVVINPRLLDLVGQIYKHHTVICYVYLKCENRYGSVCNSV